MYDKGKIIAGLLIFLGLLTYPFYSNMGRSIMKATPSLNTPIINQLDKEECVEPADYMKKNHMKVLNEWRDEVIREGKRDVIQAGGMVFEKSLQNGCLQCHSNKKMFCDECHNYAGVKPYCWDCHFSKEGGML